MEKLSSILPKSSRTQNVDNSNAQPARPGAPLLGRPMGRATQKVVFENAPTPAIPKRELDLSFADQFSVMPTDKVTRRETNTEAANLSNYNRKGDMQKVKIAENVGRNFAKIDGTKIETNIPELEVSEEELTSMEAS